MVKVIEHGTRKITCPHCKAKLEYNVEDIQSEEVLVDSFFEDEIGKSEFIICPDCMNRVPLK